MSILLPQLRDKQALVMSSDNSAELLATPTSATVHGRHVFKIDGKFHEDDTLDAKIESSDRDDLELALRAAFRTVPEPKWNDLVQQISYGLGFSGTVRKVDVRATAPGMLATQ